MENKLEKRIEIAAPVARVWRALTDSSQFGEWFLVKMEGPFVAGQAVAGQLTHPGYEHVKLLVIVKAIKPTSYFSYSWHPYAIDPDKDYTDETPTLVEFRLEEIATGTLLVLTETGFDQLPSERYADAFRMNTSGWEQQMLNIAAYATQAK